MLLLYAERHELPAIRAVDAGLQEAFAERGGVEVFAGLFRFRTVSGGAAGGGLISLLRSRYSAEKLNLVIPEGLGSPICAGAP